MISFDCKILGAIAKIVLIQKIKREDPGHVLRGAVRDGRCWQIRLIGFIIRLLEKCDNNFKYEHAFAHKVHPETGGCVLAWQWLGIP